MKLSDLQKQEICKLSRIVYDTRVSAKTKSALAAMFGGKTKAFNAWRREEQARAVGRESLCECSDSDYCPLMAHFYLALGNNYKAGVWIMRASTDEKRKVLHIIMANCLRGGLDYPSYPNAICRSQFKCELYQASESQLFCLLSTIRNRIAQRKKQHAAS